MQVWYEQPGSAAEAGEVGRTVAGDVGRTVAGEVGRTVAGAVGRTVAAGAPRSDAVDPELEFDREAYPLGVSLEVCTVVRGYTHDYGLSPPPIFFWVPFSFSSG